MSDFAMSRLAAAGLSLPVAAKLPPHVLFTYPGIGRKIERFVRTYQGPQLPLPVLMTWTVDPEDDEDDEYAERFNDWEMSGGYTAQLDAAMQSELLTELMMFDATGQSRFEDVDFLLVALEA